MHDDPAMNKVAEQADPERQPAEPFHHGVSGDQTLSSVIAGRFKMLSGIVGGLLAICLCYCLIAPKEYEARARVALRAAPLDALSLDGAQGEKSGSFASGQTQLETLASVLRSDQLAWRVILQQKLYDAPAFKGRLDTVSPGFQPEKPDVIGQNYLLERFHDALHVGTVPRTLVIEVRFRSRDARLSADVVNGLIGAYGQQESDLRTQATQQAAGWLKTQIRDLKARSDQDERRLAEFQRKHGILIASSGVAPNGQTGADHLPALVEVDELSRELAAANSERLLREAEYRAASEGDAEAVLAFDPRAQTENSELAAPFREMRARRSALEQELTQLSIERGPNFPRVVEIRQELKDLDGQITTAAARLREQFHSAWAAAVDHERLVQASLKERTGEGLKANQAASSFETMRREADANEELYLKMQGRLEEAAMTAGLRPSDFWVVDLARPPVKPVAPDLPVYMALTLFAGVWVGLGSVLAAEWWSRRAKVAALLLLAAVMTGTGAQGQAPTPSTSGLPTGVARIPQTEDNRNTPSSKDAPPVWNGAQGTVAAGLPAGAGAAVMPAPIAPGDVLDVSEFHTPEFHTTARVSAAGTVKLPWVDEVKVQGLDELQAGRAIGAALVERGILNRPQVFVVVTAFIGQDVSVLGEVGRPGVYPFGAHHRLLDLISAAAGLTPMAGASATVYHRDSAQGSYSVMLAEDRETAGGSDGNPELMPGDTVRVSRAGLVYVVGDVIRPGGFTVDPAQEMTVLKALSLAWGPSQNAATRKAILIREQKGGRTVTALDLKRMLRGQDPDQPIKDRDILFVPDSTAKNLFNRTVESAIQSAAGVSIYAGMVYSQRF